MRVKTQVVRLKLVTHPTLQLTITANSIEHHWLPPKFDLFKAALFVTAILKAVKTSLAPKTSHIFPSRFDLLRFKRGFQLVGARATAVNAFNDDIQAWFCINSGSVLHVNTKEKNWMVEV
jgi:hypothetical protein